jgi:hypothetical protein
MIHRSPVMAVTGRDMLMIPLYRYVRIVIMTDGHLCSLVRYRIVQRH